LAAQFVRFFRETANYMPQFVQEDRYLRGERGTQQFRPKDNRAVS
jgi:hypothetical protein